MFFAMLVGGSAIAQSGDRNPSVRPGRGLPSRGNDARSGLARAAVPRILIPGSTVAAPSATRIPFVDAGDGVVCIAPEMLRGLGVDATADIEERTVTLKPRDGRRSVVLPARKGPAGRNGLFVACKEAVDALGGVFAWDPATREGRVLAVIESAAIVDGAVEVRSSLPVTPRMTIERDPGRVVVDFPMAALGDVPRQPGFRLPGVAASRMGQFDETTARLVLETESAEKYSVRTDASRLRVALGIELGDRFREIGVNLPERILPGTPVGGLSLIVAPEAVRPGKSNLRRIAWGSDPTRFEMRLATNGLPPVVPRIADGRIAIDLPTTTVSPEAVVGAPVPTHPLVRSARLEPSGERGSRVMLEVAEPSRFTVRLDPKSGLSIHVSPLTGDRSGEAPLAGKTIAVDPGHGGGGSPGARGVDGNWERHHTLAMGRYLVEALERLGANVVVTRDSDSDPGLSQRGPIANRAAADLFLSIHCNSAPGNRSANGAIVYFHKDSGPCRELAEWITDSLRRDLGRIRVLKPQSDGTIYRNGFAVLRTSAAAGVLVETGFLTNSRDAAALRDPAVQRTIADCVARGAADYLLAFPDRDTRNVKPQKEGPPVVDPEEEGPPSFLPPLPDANPPSNGAPPPTGDPGVGSGK
ncbi:MAG: N-acetylmuramoyl-L-alanine amidase [Armatimonadota bacterium]